VTVILPRVKAPVSEPISMSLAADHPNFRKGLREVLDAHADLKVLAARPRCGFAGKIGLTGRHALSRYAAKHRDRLK
jgi:hypothetical protein